MKRLLSRIALACVAAAVTLLVADRLVAWLDPWGISNIQHNGRYFAEAVVGVPGPDGGLPEDGRLFQHQRNLDLDFGPFRLATNAMGMRNGTPGGRPAARPPHAPADGPARGPLRILCLGDSITFGWGVDDADTWVRLLEREHSAADRRPLECLNAGHLMYDTVQEADWFEAFGPQLRPDLVILSFLSNDLSSSHSGVLERLSGEAPDLRWRARLKRFMRRWFPALHDLELQSQRQQVAGRVARGDFPGIEESPGYPEGWPRCAEALQDIADRCQVLGAELVVLQAFPPAVPELADWCSAQQVPLIDARFTPDQWALGLVNSASDPHPNARGNRILAHKIAANLQGLGWLD